MKTKDFLPNTLVCHSSRVEQVIRISRERGIRPGMYSWECFVCQEKRYYVITDKILNASDKSLVCALIDYATHIFGKEHSKFLAWLKNRIFRMPDVYQIVKDEGIDMENGAAVQVAAERHINACEVQRIYLGVSRTSGDTERRSRRIMPREEVTSL